MSDTVLVERLKEGADDLDAIQACVATAGSRLMPTAFGYFSIVGQAASDLRRAQESVVYRRACWESIIGLKAPENGGEDGVRMAGHKLSFDEARHLLVQAYLASAWALYDSVAEVAVKVHCVDSLAKDQTRTSNLLTHFSKESKYTSSLVRTFVNESFGWPIALSYIVRNAYVHDGGVFRGRRAFSGTDHASGFALSDDAWRQITEKAMREYKVTDAQTRCGDLSFLSPPDLTDLLGRCHREIDDVCGIVIKGTCRGARSVAEAAVESPRAVRAAPPVAVGPTVGPSR